MKQKHKEQYEQLQRLEDDLETLREYRRHYQQYRVISDVVVDKNDVLEDLAEMPDAYKSTIIPLIEIIKTAIVSRSVKIMDKVDYIFYVN